MSQSLNSTAEPISSVDNSELESTNIEESRQSESNVLNIDHTSNDNNRPWSSFISNATSFLAGSQRHADSPLLTAQVAKDEQSSEGTEIVDEELTCPICHDIMKDVFVTVCGHSYCHECITFHLERNSDCPICRSPLGTTDIYPNFQLNKLAEFRRTAHKENVPLALRKDPVEKIINEKEDIVSIANSLVDLLSAQDLTSILKVAIQRKKMSEAHKTALKNDLLHHFLTKLKSNNKKKISQLIAENCSIQLDFDYLSYQDPPSSVKKRKHYAVDDDNEEEEESIPNPSYVQESAKDRTTRDRVFSTDDPLLTRMHIRFDDLRNIFHSSISVNEGIAKRRKLLTQFSSTLYELTRYAEFDVLDTLYYTDSNRMQNTTSIVSSIEFDRDNEFFAVGGVTRDIKLYDFSMMGLKRFSSMHCPVRVMMCGSKISCLSWSPYIKSQIASSDYDGTIDVWDVNLGRKILSFDEHKLRAWSVDICRPNPTLLASGSDDSTVKIWSLTQNKSVCTIEMKGNVCCAKFAPSNGNLIAIGSADHHISLYDFRYPTKPVNTYLGHKKAVSYVKWFNDREIISASTDSTLKLWNVEIPQCKMTYVGHQNEKNFVGLSLNENWISCGSENNTMFTYHKLSPIPVATYRFPKPQTTNGEDPPIFVSSVCWKKDSTKIITSNSRGIINVLEMN